MEPESHRLDREAMLAEHREIAERVQREVDAAAERAMSKRQAFLVDVVDRVRLDAEIARELEQILRELQVSGPGTAADRTQLPSSDEASEDEAHGGTDRVIAA